MTMHRNGIFLMIILSIWLTAGATDAQVVFVPVPAVTVSVGYSNVETQKANDLFYEHNGSYIDADFAWGLPLVLPVQVGIGATGSGYSDRQSANPPVYDDNEDGDDYDNDNNHLYSDLGMFEIEPRIGLRLGGQTGFFAVPRVGAGVLVDTYAIDQEFTDNNGNAYLSTKHHTGAAFELRPAIRAGYSWGFVSAGVEGSYMYAWGDFGGLGHHAEEVRAGIFVDFQF